MRLPECKQTEGVLSLPTRDGNWHGGRGRKTLPNGFKPTYKGWKLIFAALVGRVSLGFKPTYKGWKQFIMKGINGPEKRF